MKIKDLRRFFFIVLSEFERFASCCEFWVAIRNCECLEKLKKTKETTLIYFALDWILKLIACVGWQRDWKITKNMKCNFLKFLFEFESMSPVGGSQLCPWWTVFNQRRSTIDFKYWYTWRWQETNFSNFSLLTSSRHRGRRRQSSLDHCWSSLKLKSLFSDQNALPIQFDVD